MLSDFEREKSSSTRFTPNGVYQGIVKRVDLEANSVWVELPRVVQGYQFGPLVVSAATLPRVGAKVSCMFLEDRMDDIVILGISLDHNSPYYIIPAACLSTDKPINPQVGQIIWETNTGAFSVWNGSTWTGVAALTATKLATARTIALSGDVSGSVSFDGSVDVTVYNSFSAAASAALDARYVNHSEYNTTGSIIYATGVGTTAPLAIGSATTVLHGGTTPSYSQIATNDIASGAVTISKLTLPNGVVLTDAAQTCTTGVLTDITWGTEVSDLDGWTSGGSATLTVPTGKGGRYLISFTGEWTGGTGFTYEGWVWVNSNIVASHVVTNYGSSYVVVTLLRTLAAGDTVKCSGRQNTGANQTITSRLEVAWVGP